MKSLVKFGLSAIALCSLVACGAKSVSYEEFNKAATEAVAKTHEFTKATLSGEGEDGEKINFEYKLSGHVYSTNDAMGLAYVGMLNSLDPVSMGASIHAQEGQEGTSVSYYTSGLRIVAKATIDEDGAKYESKGELEWNEFGLITSFNESIKADGETEAMSFTVSYSK